MNPQETEQVIARDELWVPTAERVNISTTNVRLETTVKQKEETFQVVIDVIKNSTCIKAFTISADVPEILMQQFWYTITKIKGSESYEFLLADKRCVIDAEVFRKILDICPRKEGEDFTEVQNDEDTLTFLVDLGYSGPLHKYTNMFVDHMHQPWRTLAACINKCLSGKTASNDKLRKSRIDILWGMFYRENVDYPSLIWEDIAYQIDHRQEKKSRRENMPYPRFTKVITDYFLSKHKSLKKIKFQHFHTIKDDGVIIQSESYKRFILYSTGQIPPKKSRGKGSQGKKYADPTEESIDVSDESKPEPLIRRKTSSRRVTKKKGTISVDDNIVLEPDIALELGKSISLTEAAARQVHATHARILSRIAGECYADAEDDNEETESDSDDIYKYKINVRKNADPEMKDAEKTTDITKETTEQPLTSSSFSVPSDYGNQFLNLSHKEEILKQPLVLQQTTPIPTTITTPPINTEALTITPQLSQIWVLAVSFTQTTHSSTSSTSMTYGGFQKKHCASSTTSSTKKRRKRESESAQKPSTTKESSKGKDPKVGSKTGRSAPAKDPVEEPTTRNYGVLGEVMLKGTQTKSSRKSTDLRANTPVFNIKHRYGVSSLLNTTYRLSDTASRTASRLRPNQFTYPERELIMEEILYKFINEGKREHEEMRAFINDFKTTNEILLKERDDSLIELRFEVQKLLRIIESPPTSNCKIKGVTTRGGKTTTHEVQKDDTNMNGEEPPKEAHDKLRKTQESIQHIDPVNTLYSEKKPELEKISKEEKSSLLQVLKKLKKAEDLATCHFSRFENPHMEVLTEREIADKLFDDHLMVLKSKFKDDEPWYADFVNYIVGKVVPPN
ncbi:hypothetical protein Tco_0754597 [Tanacetum coccineum]